MCLGFVTGSNKPFIRFGVTGPILKSTTEVTWAGLGRENTGQRMKLSKGALDSQHDTPVYYHYYLNDLIGLSLRDIAPSMISLALPTCADLQSTISNHRWVSHLVLSSIPPMPLDTRISIS
jgi:hypothetical protein